ncbi:hypothetical protein NDK50_08025 [Paraburkholderia bryophila]|uniref:hypothetical protein n=1 Tax=Paraburkholderia bryophila TaxID=420952 RepID=UPI00234BF857|nr:hypothetical protein [Paraburkholderia bryophila]WCM21383.1 hypothetical protein NDK50_08025 [Paraburkholderia bryophila]
MKVKGQQIPDSVVEVGNRRMRSGEFDVQHIRSALSPAIISTGLFDRRVAYDAADALATRLVSLAARQGRIKKVVGTRRWVAA